MGGNQWIQEELKQEKESREPFQVFFNITQEVEEKVGVLFPAYYSKQRLGKGLLTLYLFYESLLDINQLIDYARYKEDY